MNRHLRIGTRGSKLALAQATSMEAAIRAAHPTLSVELIIIQTKGDLVLDRALSRIGDKGLFVTEIEQALLHGTIDLAVHSAKDLPSQTPDDLVLAAFPRRADPRDVLISRHHCGLLQLPAHARIGTSSLRRACQLQALRPDCSIVNLRGNVDTRLRKAQGPDYDAIVLAAAGLERLELSGVITEVLPVEVMLPAVAQGALALECRAGDVTTLGYLQSLDDPLTRVAVLAERAFLAHLQGGCQVPLAAFATCDPATDQLVVRGLIGQPDGSSIIRGATQGPCAAAEPLGIALAEELLSRGGFAILEQLSHLLPAVETPEEA
ncbi:MAG: hydroxymethylbilane synthase [Herpetosiphonaceae bacterium]|nr:hydroxymethylbilane synthase [Herpetosiphonaceae bacterium]